MAMRATRRRWTGLLLAIVVCGLAAGGCFFGGAGGEAQTALHIDEADPDLPVLAVLERDLGIDEPFWVRLELGEPTEADHVLVRFELRVGGRTYFEVEDYRFDDVQPPWQVAAIPLSISQDGDWNIAFVVNSRKVTDVKVSVRR